MSTPPESRHSADKIQAEQVRWLWPVQRPGQAGGALDGRIAEAMLHFVAGPRDKGKGLTVVRIGADLIKAGYNVLHSAIEDSPGLMTKPRYQAAGVRGDDLKKLHLWRFRLPAQQAELEEYVVQHNIHAIIIDPLASHLSGGINRHSDRIRQVTDPLTAFIETTPTHPAVIVVDHTLKGGKKGSDPLDRIGGSGSGMVAASRMGFMVGVDPDTDGDRILAHIKGNICERRPALRFEIDTTPVPVAAINEETGEPEMVEEDFPYILYSEETIFDPMRLLESSENGGKIGRPGDKRAAACEALTNYLFRAHVDGLPATADHEQVKPGEGVPAGRVFEDMKHLGITEKTARRAKTEMGVEVNPPGGGRNCKWNLSDEVLGLLGGGDAAPLAMAPAPDTAAEAANEEVPDGALTVNVPTGKVTEQLKDPKLDSASPEFDAELAKLVEQTSRPGPDPQTDDQAGI